MDTGDITPTLSLVDLQRGFKHVAATLKSGDAVSVRVEAVSWEQLAAIHMEHGTDSGAIEQALIERCLPAMLDDHADYKPRAWLEWLDMESRNHLLRVVREFAYGFQAEKKRTAAIREISKLLSSRNRPQPSNASGSGSATPSPGAVPSSDDSLNGFAALKPTTA